MSDQQRRDKQQRDQQHFSELWTDYLEGELDESGVVELRDLLNNDEALMKLAADLYQSHRLLGLIAAEESTRHEQFVQDTLSRLPEDQEEFTSCVMNLINEKPQSESCEATERIVEPVANSHHNYSYHNYSAFAGWFVAALSITALIVVWFQANNSQTPTPNQPTPGPIAQQSPDAKSNETDALKTTTPNINTPNEVPKTPVTEVATKPIRFNSLAHAKFFGELTPIVASTPETKRDYVLLSGLVELSFPQGASAIIEGPAVFRVMSEECLALDAGRCSVHAPDGAEGFRVDTPVTKVVDRGTRFMVSVTDTNETEIQVVEGAADVYRNSEEDMAANRPAMQLTEQQARLFTQTGTENIADIEFQPQLYRKNLPDRVIAYDATRDEKDRVVDLTQVTVQRGGKVLTVPVEDLIPVTLTWFKPKTLENDKAYLITGEQTPNPRHHALSDFALNSGVINPGGSVNPLTTDPVMDSSQLETKPNQTKPIQTTPGMAVRFKTPVINQVGPDVVFFDLQTSGNPPDGDAFHVSPLKFHAGLKSHTITAYDLTMSSPDAYPLTDFHMHWNQAAVASFKDFESVKLTTTLQPRQFRILVVGIDLSDLGYRLGEQVEGLFFQDAYDDQHYVDPVFIGGLPEFNNQEFNSQAIQKPSLEEVQQ